jgi:hypothetical protein
MPRDRAAAEVAKLAKLAYTMLRQKTSTLSHHLSNGGVHHTTPTPQRTRPEASNRGKGGEGSCTSKSGDSRYDARTTINARRAEREKQKDADFDSFPAFSARLQALLLPKKFKPYGISKYDGEQDPKQWLHCYALSITNVGGYDDTKCIYFPFVLEQEPLTWFESLKRGSIDNWGPLKQRFTSNFVGSLGRHGTRMDLALIKQKQGKTLREYMRRFFEKRATVVDVTEKEVIDTFRDGFYDDRLFQYFGRARPTNITKLKEMITHWEDEEDKARNRFKHLRNNQNNNNTLRENLK